MSQRADLERLHELSVRLVGEDALPGLLQSVIDAAIDVAHARMGTLQLYDEPSNSLRIVAHRGFEPPFLEHFAVVHEGPAVCGEALRRRERVIVEDVWESPIFLGTPTMAVMQAAGVRAVQTTLVVSRDARLLGMIATHWTEPHRPGEFTLHLLDLLAHEAGALIEIRQREERLAYLASFPERNPNPILEVDREGRVRYANPAALRLLPGIEELGAAHPWLRDWDSVARSLGEGRTPTNRIVWFEGRCYQLTLIPVPGQEVVRVYGLDVTEQKNAEQAARDSEALLRDVLETVADPIFVKDEQSRLTLVNRATLEAVGKPMTEILGHSDREFYEDPAVGEAILEHDRRVMESGAVHVFEETIQTPDGYRVFLNTKAPRRDASGRVTGLVGVARDITERKRAEEILRSSEQRLRLAQSAARLGIWEWEPATGRVTWTPELESMYGYAPGTFPGIYEAFTARVHPDDLATVERRRDEAVRDHGTFEVEFRALLPSGETRWINCKGAAEYDPAGRPMRVFGVNLDVTDRQRAEEQIRRAAELFSELIERAPFGIYVVDAELRISQMNSGSREGAFRNVRPVVGRDLGEAMRILWPEPVAAEVVALFRRTLETGEPYVSPRFTNPRADLGIVESYEWELHRITLPDGRAGVICYYYDSTALRRIEAELRTANERLVETDRQKNEFLAVLSHELRNPLAPIRNSVHVLQRSAPGSDQARRAQEIIDRQVRHMARLVEDLLDLTRITSGTIRLERTRLDLGEIVRRTAEDHRSLFVESGVLLDLCTDPAPVWVAGDRFRLAQVIGNLLLNAAKFTPRGGCATVALASEPATGRAVLRVSDTGLGMEPGLLSRLFQPFVQADLGLDRSKGGLGLGLALVRQLVDRHGGTVEARSEGLGMGSELVVSLPLDVAASDRATEDAGAAVAPGRRILVIEDNVDAAESLRDLLRLDGHEVEVAYSGPEGIARARAFRPEVVVCDVGLPGMDGYEVARAFREDEALRSVRLVALSGYALPEDLERAKEAGFGRHVAKPPGVDEIRRALAED